MALVMSNDLLRRMRRGDHHEPARHDPNVGSDSTPTSFTPIATLLTPPFYRPRRVRVNGAESDRGPASRRGYAGVVERRRRERPMPPNRYTTLAPVYDLLVLRLLFYERAVDSFIARLPFPRDQQLRVLDAGCGTGLYTFAVLKRFPRARVTAFDVNAAMLERLRGKLAARGLATSVRVESADVSRPLRFGDERFDLVVAGGVLEHVDPGAAVRNLAVSLAPDGTFLHAAIRDNVPGRFAAWFWRCRPLSRSRMIAAFGDAGLRLADETLLPRRYVLMRGAKEAFYFVRSPAP
jgi:SAM-dependent methyltransferase